jgi:phospholipase/carboxylesterase
MNRINDLVDDELQLGQFAPNTELADTATPGGELPHCLFLPQHYEVNYSYPLIVWLHGADDDERQVNRIAPLVSLRNYAAIGPRGTVACQQAGYRWSQKMEHIAAAEERVFKSIRIASRWLNIASTRIYLAGYGCGGTMALRLALANPGRFAGVLSIGGGLPTTLRPLARFDELRGTKVFLATGRHSDEYPEAAVCRDLRLMHAANMAVNLRQYPTGDDVTTDMLADMNRWIMEQIATATPVASDEHSHRR